jgi:tetratricopeptide (TPR) repeat protein
MRHGRYWLTLPLFFLSAWLVWSGQEASPKKQTPTAKKGDESAEELSPEEQKEKLVAARFRQVLETNPRRGTALDRLYGYHVERGTLDKLIGEFRERTQKDSKDGVAWMIIGLLEAQRGKEANAVAAFTAAEKHLPDNAMPPYYLGQSLVLVGQPDAAAEAFERAIARNPNRNDLLDIFQALGRVYQRAQRTEKALAVWKRLEELFPDDPRVQDQIATTLTEESQYEQALPRVEKLIKQTQDPYRKATLQMDAAELKVKLKRTPQALADFEKLLADLNPDSWLYREVRRRIEDVFLRNDDLSGLAKYYEAWVAKNPTDVEAIARLAKSLSSQGRLPEAQKWLEKGIDVAPTRKELRQALIDQLIYEQKFGDAAAQYEAMARNDPNNPDLLREWGKVILKDKSKPEAERKEAAVAVWKKLLERRPKDPLAASQVADLVRSAALTDEAIALYKNAIELAPDAAQYREYLGEFYHSLKRSDEALATWRPIAEGANRNAKNLTRLAEVLSGFGYKKEALAALGDALTLEKDDINLYLTYADLLGQQERHDEALAQLDKAQKLISNAEEGESVLQAQIKVYEATDTLDSRAEALRKELDAGKEPTAERWHRLARFYEASRAADEATGAITKAIGKDPKSIPILTSAARIHESSGSLTSAADTYRQLANLDRRYRTEHLTNVAKIEARLGRRDQALQAGRDLLAAAPGNPDHYKFFAELCFQLGDPEEGLESLRRSVRANPSEPQGLLTLAGALSERQRAGEAIELLWRAFDKTSELEGKLSIIGNLTELYLQQNQFDKLLERLERERGEAEKAREMTMCIAQAYQSAGDYGTARGQLERLLTENTRDTALLNQLSQLAESEGDLSSATKYQRQLDKAAPNNHDSQLRLAQLLVRSGEAQEAADIWVKLVEGETEPHRNLQAIDQLFTNDKQDAVLAITGRLLAQRPGDWELLYREGVALADTGKKDEALARFKAILALKLPDDEPGAAEKFRKKQKTTPKGATPGSQSQRTARRAAFDMPDVPLLRRSQNIWELRSYTGIEPRYYYGGGRGFWTPIDYGQARLACLAWQLGFAIKDSKQDEVIKVYRDAKDKPNADQRVLWDWYYLQLARQDHKEIFEVARRLASGQDPSGQLAFLSSLGERTVGASPRYSRGNNPDRDTTPALPPEQIELMLNCFRKLRQQKPDWLGMFLVQNVVKELKRAKRPEEDQIYRDTLSAANTPVAVTEALGVAAERGDVETVLTLFGKLEKLQGPPAKAGTYRVPTREAASSLAQAMGKRAEAKAYADVTKLLDLYLAHQRRLNQAAPKSSSTTRQSLASRGQMQIILYVGGQRRGIQIDFPQPNEYFDEGAITLLRNAYEVYKKADLASDLFTHFRKLADPAPADEKVYHLLALGYLHWWNSEKEEALNQLTLAAKQVPADVNMLIDVAELRERNNEPDVALALLDSIMPLDHQTMQRRERAALRLAERTGNVGRARQAADRLFGLRLDAETQVELAGKMHHLGMHEMAETVLARAQRQAGSRTNALVSLMRQYQESNQQDLAVLIARQLLRKAPTMRFDPYNRGYDETASARDQAIQTLARSGQLKEMIERAESQLKTSPNSLQIHQSLLDLYKAAGDKEKYKSTAQKMADIKPDDGKLRMQIATQLQQIGENAAAVEHYKVAMKKEPQLFAYRYWEIFQCFQQANKNEELHKLFDEIDFRQMGGNYWTVMEVIEPLIANEKTREHGMQLFKKAWAAFPYERTWMLGFMERGNVSDMPEMYDYARQAILPLSEGPAEPWRGCEEIMSYGGEDGRVTGLVTRFLEIAQRQNRTQDLRAEIEQLIQKKPEWSAGKALLAIFDLRRGQVEPARKRWLEVLDNKKDPMPPMARWILGQELEYYAGVEDLYLRTLEEAADDTLNDRGDMDFSYSPMRKLVKLYEKLGRKDDARKVVMRCLREQTLDYDPGYNAYRRINNAISVASYFQQQDEPVEAVRIYNELLADRDTLSAANRYYDEGMETRVEQSLRSAMKSLKPKALPGAVRSLLTPREAVAGQEREALDLVLAVEPRDLTKATLTSMLSAAVKAASKSPELRTEFQTRLSELVGQYPKDFSVQVAACLGALADEKPEVIAAAIERLEKLADTIPLEDLPAGTKANARQRAQAASQMGLWLVARECLAKKDLKDLQTGGQKLAQRSVQAAKRQLEPLYALAILREWGQIELDRGDKKAAEAHWGEMLNLLLPAPAKKPTVETPATPGGPVPVPAATPTAPATPGSSQGNNQSRSLPWSGVLSATVIALGQVAVPPAPAASAPVTQPSNIAVVTNTQFGQAYQLAKLAADKGMTALSLKAMRDSLRGGPPVPDPQPRSRRMSYIMTASGVMQPYEPEVAFRGVEPSLRELVGLWRKQNVPASEIYELLAAAVLPEARPAEVFSYGGSPNYSDLSDRSIARLLAEVAVEAGKVDDLRSRVRPRLAQPLGELSARALLLTLALRAKDDAQAAELLKELTQRLQKDTLQTTADLVVPAAADALERAELGPLALPALEKAARNLAANNAHQKATELFFRMARYHQEHKNEAVARQTFKEIEDLGKKAALQEGNPARVQLAQRLAEEYFRAGWTDDALAQLGRYADGQNPDGQQQAFNKRRTSAAWTHLFPQFCHSLVPLPGAKRYELLKSWSLPAGEQTKAVRMLTGTLPQHVPIAAFGTFPLPAAPGETVSSLEMLVQAARESGKLAELAAEAEKLTVAKVDNASTLGLLARLAAGQGKVPDKELQDYVKELRERSTKVVEQAPGPRYWGPDGQNQGPPPVQAADFLVARACLADAKAAGPGEQMMNVLLGQAQRTQNYDFQQKVRKLLDEWRAAGGGAPQALAKPGLAGWHNASARSIWVAADGHVGHLYGDQPGYLLFDIPLAGTFEFSVDGYQGGWAEGHAGYGGIVFEPNRPGVNSSVWQVGNRDHINRPNPTIRSEDFNRLTIQVEPGKVRALMNGEPFYEDTDSGGTSPWLMLVSQSAARRPVWRNFSLSGKPEVLSEVKLTSGNSLDGWMTHVYGARMPDRMAKKERDKQKEMMDLSGQVYYSGGYVDDENPRRQQQEVYDWEAKDGEIVGRKEDVANRNALPSKLAYFRPLLPGEKLRYEFFYEPGKTQVCPSLGRLAFLLEPEGVKLHWLTDQATNDWTGLKADNAVAVEGQKPLPLKAGEWNAVVLALTDDSLKIELNGTPVLEHKLEPTTERLFGFFHYRDKTAARVRNAVLTGNWPKELPKLDQLGFVAKAASPVEARVRRTLIGERAFGLGAGEVLKKARGLSAAERYKLLADWVLPNEGRPLFQLAGEWTPLDVAPPVFQGPLPEGRQVLLGSRFDSPALELLAAAKEANKLDDLAARIEKFAPPLANDLEQRGKTAMLAAVRSAQGKIDQARLHLDQLTAVAKQMPIDLETGKRWPEFIAASATLGNPAVRPKTLALLNAMLERLQQSVGQNKPFPNRDEWIGWVRHLRGQAQALSMPEELRRPYGSDPNLAYWSPVNQVHAWTRGPGRRTPHWVVQGSEVKHFPGCQEDYLCLNVPLTGDFTMECELTSFGWREAHVAYAGVRFDFMYDKKSYFLHVLNRGGPKRPIDPPFAKIADWYKYRLEVKDGRYTIFIEDRKILSEPLDFGFDPWLLLQANVNCTAGIRNIKISGSPKVPEVIDLSSALDLKGWLRYDTNYDLQKRGNELYLNGRKFEPVEGQPEIKRSYQQQAMHYHRPMIEDGVIDYDFYYEPDVTLVHPMMDRLTFLLEPTGVRIHWLTDNVHERTGLKPENVSDEPDNRRGPAKLPLKDKAWNHMRLTLKGDVVTLTLNGQDIYERKLESTNMRLFGLFNYADASEARVRSVTYRGDWPKQLPTAGELFKTK